MNDSSGLPTGFSSDETSAPANQQPANQHPEKGDSEIPDLTGASTTSLPGLTGDAFNAKDKTVISSPANARPEELLRSVSITEVARVLEGKTLDHFVLDQLVGGGGMGAVFRGRDVRLERTVAIKVIPAHRRDADTLRRFRIEAQAAARLDHPNIARVYYVGEADAWNYIVFEFIDGINVRDLVTRDGPLSLDDAIFYTRQVAEALQHALEREVVHRDIKPSNLLVTPGGQVKLVDMGLARSTSMDRSSHDMTASGVTLGTFDYISPEQARDPRDADVRSDLYSLGCTLYYMLTGQPPFPDGTAIQKLLSHGSQPPPDPRELRPDLSDELVAILIKLMAKRPTDRYQRPSELIGDLMLLAEMEQLTRSRMPGTIAVTPTIAQRSWLETHLPWMVATTFLIASVLWMQNADSWSTTYVLPQPEVNPTSLEPAPGSIVENGTTAARPATLPNGTNASGSSPLAANSGTNASGASSPSLNGSSGVSRVPSESSTASGRPSLVDANYGPEFSALSSRRANMESNPAAPPSTDSIAAANVSKPPMNAGDSGSKTVERPTASTIDTLIIGETLSMSLTPNQSAENSLAAALARAAKDLSIQRIVVASSQLRPGSLKIPRSGLTLEAAPGFTPTLLWNLDANFSSSSNSAAIDLGDYALRCSGIEFRLVASDSGKSGAMWRMGFHGNLALEQCTITLEDTSQLSGLSTIVVAAESNATGPSSDAADQGDPLQLGLENCVVRGEGDFVKMPIGKRAEIRWNNGLLAVTGSMLRLGGNTTESARPPILRLLLTNLTSVTEKGFCIQELSSQYPAPICVVRQASASTFAVGTGKPFIQIVGLQRATNTADLIQLRGDDNAYDSTVQTFCEIRPVDAPAIVISIRDANENWFQERSVETFVRWSNPSRSETPMHRRTPAEYEQRGAMFIPGFQPSRLPQPTSQSTQSP